MSALPPPVPVATPVPAAQQRSPWTFLLMAGGAALILGAFLPWIEATTFFGTISRSGISYGEDAIITAGIGVGLAAYGIALFTGRPIPRWVRWLAIAGGVIAAGILAYDYSQIQDRVEDITADADGAGFASVGAGLYVSLAGAVAAIVGTATAIPNGRGS